MTNDPHQHAMTPTKRHKAALPSPQICWTNDLATTAKQHLKACQCTKTPPVTATAAPQITQNNQLDVARTPHSKINILNVGAILQIHQFFFNNETDNLKLTSWDLIQFKLIQKFVKKSQLAVLRSLMDLNNACDVRVFSPLSIRLTIYTSCWHLETVACHSVRSNYNLHNSKYHKSISLVFD